MNTRTIVLILALLTLISTATGGYLYYHSNQKAVIKEIDSNFAQATEELKQDIVEIITLNQNQVKAMSLIARIQKALVNQDQATLSLANTALDQFAEGFAHDVCYLMDTSGKQSLQATVMIRTVLLVTTIHFGLTLQTLSKENLGSILLFLRRQANGGQRRD